MDTESLGPGIDVSVIPYNADVMSFYNKARCHWSPRCDVMHVRACDWLPRCDVIHARTCDWLLLTFHKLISVLHSNAKSWSEWIFPN